MKIRKRDVSDEWSLHKHNAKLTLQSFSNIETKAVVHSGEDSGHHTESPNNSAKESEIHSDSGNTAVFMVEIIRQENGPLGLTIAGSEDVTQPILLSGLVEGLLLFLFFYFLRMIEEKYPLSNTYLFVNYRLIFTLCHLILPNTNK